MIVARNCHKAVYHALHLQELHAQYLYPTITRGGIQGQITADQVRDAVKEHPDAAAVILTSQTYEGIFIRCGTDRADLPQCRDPVDR